MTIRVQARRLRRNQTETLARMTQAEIVTLLSAWAKKWRAADSEWRQAAKRITDPFPFAHVEMTLDALCESVNPEALENLIDAEEVRDARGVALAGHIIAGNTPLLPWTSVIRALLMRTASLVKLPSQTPDAWAQLLTQTLPDVLAQNVALLQWPGGTSDLDAALCQSVDVLLAYGSDATLENLQKLGPKQMIGYGHRVSFGLTAGGGADGFARDILLFDQSGCLSPQTIFVLGGASNAQTFAARLADALRAVADELPPIVRPSSSSARVREARTLAVMDGSEIWADDALLWTVICRSHSQFASSPTHAVVSVQPLLSLDALPAALASVARSLQGCAVAADVPVKNLTLPGVSYVCLPGRLQAPPLSWREDGRDVLRVFLPPHRADGSTNTVVAGGSVSGESVKVGES